MKGSQLANASMKAPSLQAAKLSAPCFGFVDARLCRDPYAETSV